MASTSAAPLPPRRTGDPAGPSVGPTAASGSDLRAARVRPRPVRGANFLMFEDAEQVSRYDFSKLGGLRKLTNFLDALYIPQRLHARQFLDTIRDRAGNRSNEVAVGWDHAEADEVLERWRKWVYVRRSKAERPPQLMAGMALAAAILVCVLVGLGVQRAGGTGKRGATASRFQMTSVRGGTTAAAPVAPPASEPRVERDEQGRLVEIRGADPRSVLRGYCKHEPGQLCEPVELAWSDPPQPLLRFGVYRAFDDLRAIEIRHDPMTREWVAGDGRREIGRFLAHTLRMGNVRVPVRDDT